LAHPVLAHFYYPMTFDLQPKENFVFLIVIF